MTGSGLGAAMSAGVVLQTTPPREPRNLLERPHLRVSEGRLRDAPAVLVKAPPGFGKTALLSQWRRECLGHGAVALWLSARPEDTPKRLVHSLTLAFREAACRPTFMLFIPM